MPSANPTWLDVNPRFHHLIDRFGAAGSLLCAVHCALMPMLLALIPSLGLAFFQRDGVELAVVVFVTVLGRMAGIDPAKYGGDTGFTDVPEGMYYAPYVKWAAQYGITGGTGDGRFSPDALITRQQMAALFVRYFEKFGALKVFYESIVELAREQGYVTTMSGRRRLIRAPTSNSSAPFPSRPGSRRTFAPARQWSSAR